MGPSTATPSWTCSPWSVAPLVSGTVPHWASICKGEVTMSAPSSPVSTLSLSWAAVLDDVAKMLRATDEEALRSEQALLLTTPLLEPTAAAAPYYDRLEERFRAMQKCLARAEQGA